MSDAPYRDQGIEMPANIAAEHAAPRVDEPIAATDVWILASCAGVSEPSGEMAFVLRQERHARRRHVDAVSGVMVVVGEAAADKIARLEDRDRGILCKTGQVISDCGAGEAAERGILMRTGEAFQGYRLVSTIVLDKTGTLTEGRPAVREINVLDGTEEELLALAAAAEAASEHPLGQAVVKAAFERKALPPDVTSFGAVPGKGVVAKTAVGEVVVSPAPPSPS